MTMTMTIPMPCTISTMMIVTACVVLKIAWEKRKTAQPDRFGAACVTMLIVGFGCFITFGISSSRAESAAQEVRKNRILSSIPVEWKTIFRIAATPMRGTTKFHLITQSINEQLPQLTVEQSDVLIEDVFICELHLSRCSCKIFDSNRKIYRYF